MIKPLKLKLYRNGLKLAHLFFAPYHSKEAQDVFYDILKGFYPGKLRSKYPDGITLLMFDNTYKLYKGKVKKTHEVL
jgi:hypothetical protein